MFDTILAVCPRVTLFAGRKYGRLHRPARFSRSAAQIPAHNIPAGKALSERIERRTRQHVLEGLPHRRIHKVRRVGHQLGQLPTRRVIPRSEVRPVQRPARLTHAAARIPANQLPLRHPLNINVERTSRQHILKGLPAHRLTKARSQRHDLCQLPTSTERAWAKIGVVLRVAGFARAAAQGKGS